MILQTEIIWPYLSAFLTWVSESAGIFVLISGVIALSWLGFERKRRGSFFKRKSESESILSKTLRIILKIISYSGVIVGILDIWAGAMGLILDLPPSFKYGAITPHADHFTCIFLIVVGIAMFFKPVKDLPLASILGLLAGSATAFILALLVPDSAVEFIAAWINPKLLLIIVFIIIAVLVAFTAKFYIGVLQAISKFLSWPPVAFVIMIFGFVQGILLWGFGISIFMNLL
ncbi:MAG: hypothetical protein KGD67_08070 [Candidatus Lokiarchaeota archaeon]|nr:hypothetical protein [Candidatus Lokiarchaeota archaeon]